MKHYQINLSSSKPIICDEDDFKKFVELSSRGVLIKLKGGVVNPSFVVSIIPVGTKTEKITQGYVDQLSGNYIITNVEEVPVLVEDAFENKQLYHHEKH